MKLTRRGPYLYIRKRVPLRYASIEPRALVWISLHTDSETVARAKAPAIWNSMIEAWEARLAGDTTDADAAYAAAKNLAHARGYRFLSAKQVATLSLAEILDRVEAVPVKQGVPDRVTAAALLGGAVPPEITVSRALEDYWTLARDKIRLKSEDQIRRWQNPLKKATANFIGVVGDKALKDISADDMLEFRDWWVTKIKTEGLTPNSANKDFIHLGVIWKTVNKLKRLGLVLPLGDLALREGEKKQRPAFSVEWIRDRLLARGALDGLNTEARYILLGMVNTGYRPSEGASLLPEHIRLDHNVPHISIEPGERELKSAYARRKIPLLGVSLEAFRASPLGFPRYRDNPSLSDTVNKFLRENGLLETPAHTLYGLRHSFEDRMLAAGIDDRIRRDLFGHRLTRERYGDGASLEQAQALLWPVAL